MERVLKGVMHSHFSPLLLNWGVRMSSIATVHTSKTSERSPTYIKQDKNWMSEIYTSRKKYRF